MLKNIIKKLKNIYKYSSHAEETSVFSLYKHPEEISSLLVLGR
jgi:hypothetical protein